MRKTGFTALAIQIALSIFPCAMGIVNLVLYVVDRSLVSLICAIFCFFCMLTCFAGMGLTYILFKEN